MKYPITCILGKRGSYKTCFMTKLAYDYYHEGKTIISNYHLIGIPYTYMPFSALAQLPESLYNAVVLMDEIQVGADAYEIFARGNKAITKFATQLRKRKITLYYSTQIFTQVTKRLRLQTDYIIQCEEIKQAPGYSKISIFDRGLPFNEQKIKELLFNGKPYFSMYDTDEVISYGDENE